MDSGVIVGAMTVDKEILLTERPVIILHTYGIEFHE